MSQVITIDDLNSYMISTSVDAGLGQQIVDGINAWIDIRTGRCFGETKQVTERSAWKTRLWLRHPDVVSIDAVNLGWPGQTSTSVPSTNYYFDDFGRLTFYGNTFGFSSSRLANDYLSVQYTYGYTALGLDGSGNPLVPDDLKMAVLGIAAGMYNWASNGNRDVAAVSVGSYQLTFTNKRMSMGGAVDNATSTADANWSVIESYRLKRM